MTALSPAELATRLDGLLSFPVTPFGADGELAEAVLAEHVAEQLDHGPAALFVCCGTGEFGALSPQEHAAAVRVAVRVAAGRVPVVAGCGYGYGSARTSAFAAAEAGADGLLVLPPPQAASQDGLVAHYRALADATGLGLLVYQRDGVRLAPQTVLALRHHPRVVGLKDGLGDLEGMQRTVSAVRAAEADEAGERVPFVFLNGVPTAEMTALAYRGIGVTSYSSAVLDVAPVIALDFHAALRAGDLARVQRWYAEFFLPYVALRDLGVGYAVSLVKAGVRLRGLAVGPVRPPLLDPPEEHVQRLADLVAHGHASAAAGRST